MKFDLQDDPDYLELKPNHPIKKGSLVDALFQQFQKLMYARWRGTPLWFLLAVIGGCMLYEAKTLDWTISAFLTLPTALFSFVRSTAALWEGKPMSIPDWTAELELGLLLAAGVVLAVSGARAGFRNLEFALGITVSVVLISLLLFEAVCMRVNQDSRYEKDQQE